MASEGLPTATLQLLQRAQAGDEAAREEMVGNHLGLVRSAARRFARSGEDGEDLFQIGCEGLVKAVNRFDPAYGVQFSTYAVPLIIGEIRRHLRDQGQLRVARSLKELGARIKAAQAALAVSAGCEPTVADIARHLDTTPAEVVAAMEAARPVAYLQEPLGGEAGEAVSLQDRVEATQPGEVQWVNQVWVRECLGSLEVRLRQVILLRYFSDRTQAEVAHILGLSQAQVSRLEQRALHQLRARLEPGGGG